MPCCRPSATAGIASVGLSALRFDLQVWSTKHLLMAGSLKSELHFAVWRQLREADVAVQPPALRIQLTGKE
jgi:small-conductance mechanosensitive channel